MALWTTFKCNWLVVCMSETYDLDGADPAPTNMFPTSEHPEKKDFSRAYEVAQTG